eukprot:scaffold148429_cov19-Tisochrysis_lutea.AAC.3
MCSQVSHTYDVKGEGSVVSATVMLRLRVRGSITETILTCAPRHRAARLRVRGPAAQDWARRAGWLCGRGGVRGQAGSYTCEVGAGLCGCGGIRGLVGSQSQAVWMRRVPGSLDVKVSGIKRGHKPMREVTGFVGVEVSGLLGGRAGSHARAR